VISTNITTFNSVTTEIFAVRTSWIEAYKAYQYVALFGKSQEIYLKRVLTPTLQMLLVLRLMSMMEATTWHYYHSLTSKVSCFDYLINGLSTTDALIVAQYTTNGNAANIKVLDRCYYPLKIQVQIV
jgi:hypothetical protein